MGGFDRQSYMPAKEESTSRLPIGTGLGPVLLAIVVGVIGFVGYRYLKGSGPAEVPNSDAQLEQIVQRLDALEHRLDQIEKRRPASKAEASAAQVVPTPSPVLAEPAKPAPKPKFAFSRPVSVHSAPAPPVSSASATLPANPPTTAPNPGPAPDQASNQQWMATADRLGNVVGELDSQRDAIEQDRQRLDQLAERLAKNSQPFTLARSSDRQRVGPVWLRLQSTDPRNQRYTMRVSLEDKTLELKDRALHEAIQFYAAGGKLTFELVVSQISRDGVSGRIVLPEVTVTR
jgi:hypothetical protein